ncbi:MAG: hypothetical protein M1838_005603, partial [Thelocarpon superellum]
GTTGFASSPSSKSSSALRESIAKAKAARLPAKRPVKTDAHATRTGFISGVLEDDFGFGALPTRSGTGPSKGLLRKRVDGARTTGRLDISAMELTKIPDEVMSMYDLEDSSGAGGAWYESVDLVRFVATDNDLETLRDDIFPDLAPDDEVGEDEKGNQFGGVETIDLHGNQLRSLPLGLRRLALLTVLNLSSNKLGNGCWEVLQQCPSLRELRLANNQLEGPLPDSISSLAELTVLDLRGNGVTDLTPRIGGLVRLRSLNVAENKLAVLPFAALSGVPITECIASKNAIRGTLLPSDFEHATLQILDVCNNAIDTLSTAPALLLPALQQLKISGNRISALPGVESCPELLVLAAEDNHIPTLPMGFTSLAKIKNVNLAGNALKGIDERVGAMESLEVFRITGNPLRERRFLVMPTDDLKIELRNRLAPVEDEESDFKGESAQEVTGAMPSALKSSSSRWPIKAGGLLDCAFSKLSDLPRAELEQIASEATIRIIDLQRNTLIAIPCSLSVLAPTLVSINLSHNRLGSTRFITEPLHLPHLQTLNLSSNALTSLSPLQDHLSAPLLSTLDVSCNKLTALPAPLRSPDSLPALASLIASDNALAALEVETVKGLREIDVQNNDIGKLEPRLGLLPGLGRLERSRPQSPSSRSNWLNLSDHLLNQAEHSSSVPDQFSSTSATTRRAIFVQAASCNAASSPSSS